MGVFTEIQYGTRTRSVTNVGTIFNVVLFNPVINSTLGRVRVNRE